MFAYAVLGAAAIFALYLLFRRKGEAIDNDKMDLCDNLVYVGTAFLTIGMLFGAIWAKEAWGHYWSWDPKETWGCRYLDGKPPVYPLQAQPAGTP